MFSKELYIVTLPWCELSIRFGYTKIRYLILNRLRKSSKINIACKNVSQALITSCNYYWANPLNVSFDDCNYLLSTCLIGDASQHKACTAATVWPHTNDNPIGGFMLQIEPENCSNVNVSGCCYVVIGSMIGLLVAKQGVSKCFLHSIKLVPTFF